MGDTDAEAYIALELGTNANEQARKHGKVTLDLVIGLQHKTVGNVARRGNVLEVTASVVGLLAIVEGRRDLG